MNRQVVFVRPLILNCLAVVAAFVSLGAGSSGFAASVEIREINELSLARETVREFTRRYSPEEILYVSDYDNVLARPRTQLGGEPWYYWQHSIVDDAAKRPSLVSSADDILLLQLRYFEMQGLLPVQPDTGAIINDIQKLGVHSVVLTSRNPTLFDVTKKDLKRFGVSFAKSAIGDSSGDEGVYLPYDAKNPEESGLSAAEFEALKLPVEPRVVYYRDGLFLTRGQHKGAMLRTLLKKTGYRPKVIVFTDDTIKHLESMKAAFADVPELEMVLFRYGRNDAQVKAFELPGAIEQVTAEYLALEPQLRERMKDRSPLEWLVPGARRVHRAHLIDEGACRKVFAQ